MKENGTKGKIVLTSSVLALMSFAGYSTYSPSKYAIRGKSTLQLLPPTRSNQF